MHYNPDIHHRRSIRLKGYDYSQAGLYFVTICVQNRECLFGKITNNEMILNDAGKVVQQCWLEIPQHFPDAIFHEYIIMPNHIHGIVELVGAKNFSPESCANDNIGTPESCANNAITGAPESCANDTRAKIFSPLPPGTSRTIGSIIRGFKIGVTKRLVFSVWQRNYYEHIIRNEHDYLYISNYIIHTSEEWLDDKFYFE
jgi:REP element-mobilizing transposase RayT